MVFLVLGPMRDTFDKEINFLATLVAFSTEARDTKKLESRERTPTDIGNQKQSPGLAYLLLKSDKDRHQTVPAVFQQLLKIALYYKVCALDFCNLENCLRQT